MTMPVRAPLVAQIALGYAADPSGRGIAYASIARPGTPSVKTIRLAFTARPLPNAEGRAAGYAAVAALAGHLKPRTFKYLHIKLADGDVAAELRGAAGPVKALAMQYVRIRCALRGLGTVEVVGADGPDVRDLTLRAQAELTLRLAA